MPADGSLRRVDELLTDLIETVETARALPMSASCVLPRERLLDLLDELREVLPGEMDEARTIVARRERLMQDAYEKAAAAREQAIGAADAVLADAGHQRDQLIAEAQRTASDTVQAGRDEQARLVAATTVHQAAAEAAAALRADAERYQQQISAEAQAHDAKVRGEADRYSHDARSEAERYATKLTADAENYAERTLTELTDVLHRAATTAEQGRAQLHARRASAWAAGDGEVFDGRIAEAAPTDAAGVWSDTALSDRPQEYRTA